MNPGESIDQQWEYLSNYTRVYTIDMAQQYANTCALAVNSHILNFHTDMNTLSLHIEVVLKTIQKVQTDMGLLYPRHAMRTGLATGPDDVQEFMNISEEYVVLQHNLLAVLESINYINASSAEAHQRAVALRDANQPNGTHNG